MKRCALALLVCFVTIALAEEYPYLPGNKITPASAPYERARIAPLVINEPVWNTLERMSPAERMNSEIELFLERGASQEALVMAERIESLWNSGRFGEALVLFPELAELTDAAEMSIGNSWRTPVPTEPGICWGTDVRIGSRDSVLITGLDIHRSTGNLFAALLLQGDGNTNRWDVYMSADDGANWSETYDWWANYDISSLSISVAGYYCHVGFSRGSAQDQAFLFRFNALDGQQEDFGNGSTWITVFSTTSPDSLKELVLTSNQDYFDNRLYYLAITTQGNLRYFWDDLACTSWTEVSTGVTSAERGLDACTNEDYGVDEYYLWTSYMTTGDYLEIDARSSTSWDSMTTYDVGATPDYSAIGAYHDTVTCFFEYSGAVFHCRYNVSYDAGASWWWGYVDDTTTLFEAPDVTARKGGGVATIYRFYTSPREGRYSWRNYAGSWDTPAAYTDNQPYWNKPAIEYLESGTYGVVYLTWDSPQTRAAYFDKHVQSSVDDMQVRSPASFELLQNYPNPFNLSTVIGYNLSRPASVEIDIYDLRGRKLRSLTAGNQTPGHYKVTWEAEEASSGIYFYKIQAGDYTQTKKMLLLR